MKILRVNSAGFEEGGAESGLVAIQPILESRGHVIRTLASDSRPELPHFSYYSFRAPYGFFEKLMYTFNFSAYRALRKAILDFKPDVIHLHTLGTASPLILFALRGYPTVATVHGPEGYTRDLLIWCLPKSDFKHEEYKISDLRLVGKFRYFYYRYINYPLFRLGLHKVDRFVTISRYICRLMESQGVPSTYVPNGVKMLEFTPLKAESIPQAIVYAGRLEKFKGVDVLLTAFPKVLAEFPQMTLTIAGTGRDADELALLAEKLGITKHVQFVGHIGKGELSKLYKKVSLAVVPSIWPEVASRSGIEAMSAGLPVIGTDVGGTSDWLIDGETGYLIPPQNAEAIADAIIRAFHDPEGMERMSQNARDKAEDYAMELHAERIITVYNEVIEKGGKISSDYKKGVKIWYATDQRMDAGSAAYVHVSEICEGLRSIGNNVTLYAPKTSDTTGVEDTHAVLLKAPKNFLSVVYQPKLFFRLIRDAIRNKPDVLYVRKSQLLFVPALISILFSIPLILEVNGLVEQDAKYIDPNMLSKFLLSTKIFALIEKLNVGSATHFIVVASGFTEFLKDRYKIPKEKISLIENGVNTELFAPRNHVEVRKELGLPEAITVGYVGSFHPWQGLPYIVEAAKIVSEKRPDVRFVIAGSGAEYGCIRSFIEKNHLENTVTLVCQSGYEMLAKYKSAIDIGLCYPLRMRSGLTSPMKVYEYLSSGCAVISADIGGMREEFGDIVVYAEPESPDALASAIISLVDSKNERELLSQEGRTFIEEGHSWKVVAEKIEAICKNVS